jgi:spermidine/putrescine transport system ATP-binding protein
LSATLELRGVGQRYGETVALAGIDLAVPAGAYAVLLGPSGSGKTTLLSILGGFVEPSAGMVLIDGRDVTALPPAKRPTATVFQDYALFPHLSVAGNVGFGLAMQRRPRGERRRRVEAALATVGLAGFGDRRVHELSGGQKQRVALARALAVEPAVLLLDEPLGALDVALRRQVQGELKAVQREVGTTYVHVTHDQEEAMALADLLVVVNGGKVEDAGPPERVYLRPRTRFAATFLGDSNLIPGEIVAAGEGWAEVATAHGLVRTQGPVPDGPRATLAVRPEQLAVGVAGAGMLDLGEVVVGQAMFLGGYWRVTAQGEGWPQPLLLRLAPAPAPRAGDRLRVAVAAEHVTVLPPG